MKNPVKNLIWITAQHEQIQIRQMETSHIANCMRLIRHKATYILTPLPGGYIDKQMYGWRVDFLPTLIAEYNRRMNQIGERS